MNTLAEFPYTNILILGLAKSGTASAKILLEHGMRVRINDMNSEDENIQQLREMGADIIVGSHPLSVLDGMEIVVKNPGIPYDNPIVKEAEKRNIPIVTEIELAYYLTNGDIIGITGSNGKTTTTTLIYEMLAESKKPVKLGGNIGIAASETARETKKGEWLVLELSSFQLQGIERFKPKISVLINLFEAHLDYHKTFENYTNAKFNIVKNQTETDYFVYNYDDESIVNELAAVKAKLVPFSVRHRLEDGAWATEESIYFKNEKVMDRKDIVLVGEHNLENILAAVAAVKLSGGTNEGIQTVLKKFSGVKHRLQFVDKVNGRLFYNDSKATNMLATQKALRSFQQPVILLAGGLDRGNEFTDLLPYLKHVKGMVVFGETKDKLIKLAKEADIEHVKSVKNVREAVGEAYAFSEEGDVILLSPACASWDQYRTFEERGDMFIQAVHKLK